MRQRAHDHKGPTRDSDFGAIAVPGSEGCGVYLGGASWLSEVHGDTVPESSTTSKKCGGACLAAALR